ncbi:MAG: PaaI family thioesterase [Bacteroidales bacterium]|nr:PaaI family thioesterase [Bacteroidales bacterium]MCF8388181.1 PaaI family thioesterase [Bacteroidales bacterium]MCF8397198.1 PaaI family thioesterase [Bacteroidales bacterium]
MISLKSSLEEINQMNRGTLMETLGIEYTEVGAGFVSAKMPVDHRTLQPSKIIHGGANIALAETIGGLGSVLLVDYTSFDVRGSSISANHVGTAKSGWVRARAEIIHRGERTHVWNIDIKNEEGKLISTIRLTNFIIPK